MSIAGHLPSHDAYVNRHVESSTYFVDDILKYILLDRLATI